MNLPALDVRSLLRRYDLEPRKGLGQNFLVDHGALLKIVAAAEIQPMDTGTGDWRGAGQPDTTFGEPGAQGGGGGD